MPARPPATANSVEYSIAPSCAVVNCATQSHWEKIMSVQDRASCLPESPRRALIAYAGEIRQYQLHSHLTPEGRDGHQVRRASVFFLRVAHQGSTSP